MVIIGEKTPKKLKFNFLNFKIDSAEDEKTTSSSTAKSAPMISKFSPSYSLSNGVHNQKVPATLSILNKLITSTMKPFKSLKTHKKTVTTEEAIIIQPDVDYYALDESLNESHNQKVPASIRISESKPITSDKRPSSIIAYFQRQANSSASNQSSHWTLLFSALSVIFVARLSSLR